MSTTSDGRDAESLVAKELQRAGHHIVEQNWRTRWCEIDIVSTQSGCVYFTEVKYRESSNWGSGLEYITPKKLRQMQFAAEFWLSSNDWNGEAQILACEVDSNGDLNLIEI
jgi:uncharacterized protein (TIGR00252 family)